MGSGAAGAAVTGCAVGAAVRLDEPVRGDEVILLAATAPPVNDHLVELLALADACRRVGGPFTLVWHNSQLLTRTERRLYDDVLDAVAVTGGKAVAC